MRRLLLFFLLCISPLHAFDHRSDVDKAFRHQDWEELESLVVPVLLNPHTHRFPPNAGQLYFHLGVALWHQGKWKTASICFERVYTRYPKTSSFERLQSLIGGSDCAHRLGHYASSIRLSKKFFAEATTREWHRKSPFANGPKISGFDPFFR